jgi:HD-GYP domain-containing protein (c-di-GMP phosphodiesterase class II)
VGEEQRNPTSEEPEEVGTEKIADPIAGNGLLAATVDALSCTLGLRDQPTGVHSGRVQQLAGALGRRLRLEDRAQLELEYAAELHDIGKVGVPDALLLKPGPLLPTEWEVVRSHSTWGSNLLRTVPGLERVAVIVRHHHERFDGCGYPDGLKGEQIPVESRVLAVVDAFVAMTEERPYRSACDPESASAELDAERGAQFDPRVLDAFDAELQRTVLVRALSA